MGFGDRRWVHECGRLRFSDQEIAVALLGFGWYFDVQSCKSALLSLSRVFYLQVIAGRCAYREVN